MKSFPIRTIRVSGASPVNGGLTAPPSGFRIVLRQVIFATNAAATTTGLQLDLNPDAGVSTVSLVQTVPINTPVELTRNFGEHGFPADQGIAFGFTATAVGTPGATIKGQLIFTIEPLV